MKENLEKQEWTTPEIIDLDVEKTASSKSVNPIEIGSTAGPS